LAFLVLALAFMQASTLTRNSDFWFHLRTGQFLANGQVALGKDPFSYMSEGAYWANTSWLFDLAIYGLYGWIGGAGLDLLKALIITALAALLLSLRRRGAGIVAPAACTTLAIIAMGPRLLLQPTCLSYLFLAMTLWLLVRQEERPAAVDGKIAKYALASGLLLVALFFLWANIDEWFLLGPVVVALFWLGDRLGGQRRIPGWLIPAGLAAGLLNPYTFHVFMRLPSELSPVTWSSGLRQDARFQGLFGSAWEPAHLHAAANLNPPALAYFALVILGLASFLAYRPALRSWRLGVWLPLAALAAWQARAIPLFAIISAPITALNGQDFFLAWAGEKNSREKARLAVVIRYAPALLMLPLLALIALTWPGWLEGYAGERRRVAWGVQADPTLQHVAETLHGWRRRGLLADSDRILATAPEVAHYLAWFDPGDKQFFDHRYGLFRVAARDYVTLCQALLAGTASNKSEFVEDWRKVLHNNGVSIVVFYDHNPQRLFDVLMRVASDPEHWTLLDLPGQAVIAGWNECLSPQAAAGLAFDPERLAFGIAKEQAASDLSAVPERGPQHLLGPGDFWSHMARPAVPVSWESTAATFYLHYFHDSELREHQREMARGLGSFAASLVGLAARSMAAPMTSLQLALAANVISAKEGSNTFLVREQLGPFFARLVERSPALPLLAIRAARRAVATNPEDANAWVRLGQAYLLLRTLTCERSSEGLLPPLAQLREIQVVSALEEAVRLDPDLEPVHHELAYLYGERQAFDLALAHRLEEIRLTRRAGRRPGETEEEQADRLELLDRDTAKLEELVRKQRQNYEVGSPTLEGNREAEAKMALKLGLLQRATDTLLNASAELLRPSTIKLELQLLLELGRAADVRETLDRPENATYGANLGFYDIPPPRSSETTKVETGVQNPSSVPRASSRIQEGEAVYFAPYHWPAYEWLRILEGASLGDYDKARESLRIIRAGLAAGHERLKRQLPALKNAEWKLVPGLLSYSGQSMSQPFFPLGMVAALAHFLEQRGDLETGERLLRAQQADLAVVEASLALEQGASDDARALFGEAESLCAQTPAIAFAGQAIAAGYLRLIDARR
jgi:hypothetical protein